MMLIMINTQIISTYNLSSQSTKRNSSSRIREIGEANFRIFSANHPPKLFNSSPTPLWICETINGVIFLLTRASEF